MSALNKFILVVLILVGTLAAVFSASIPMNFNKGISYKKQNKIPSISVNVDDSGLKEGDIILRRGKSLVSELLRSTSLHDRTFSHAGIIFRENGKWKVMHAIGGESAIRDGVQSDDLLKFCSSTETDTVAVFRIKSKEMIGSEIVKAARKLQSNCTGFDVDFSLATDEKLYCTEFVLKSIEAASEQHISLPLSKVSGVKYISCENVYNNQYVQQIYPRSKNDHRAQ